MAPSFSIVTVSYNSARTIEATLASVAGQNWSQREHIIIDGGSSDGTLDIIRNHQAGLSHVVSERDAGIYDAMNKGLALATGDVVAFLNSDDFYRDESVLGDVAKAFNEKDLEAVFADVDYVSPKDPSRVVRRYSSHRFHPRLLSTGLMPAHPALFIRREVFDRAGPFRSDYKIAGDFEFVARAFGRSPIRYAHLPRVMVRMQLGGVSTAGLSSTIRLNGEIRRALRENGIPSSWPKLLSRYPFKLLEWFSRETPPKA